MAWPLLSFLTANGQLYSSWHSLVGSVLTPLQSTAVSFESSKNTPGLTWKSAGRSENPHIYKWLHSFNMIFLLTFKNWHPDTVNTWCWHDLINYRVKKKSSSRALILFLKHFPFCCTWAWKKQAVCWHH